MPSMRRSPRMRRKPSMSMDGNVSSTGPSENLTEHSVFEVNTNLCTTSPDRLATRIATFKTVTLHSAKQGTSASGVVVKKRKRRAPEETRTVSSVCQWAPARTRKAWRQSQPLEEMSRQRPSRNLKESQPLVSRAVTSCNEEQIRAEQTSQFMKPFQRQVQQCDVEWDELQPKTLRASWWVVTLSRDRPTPH